MEQFTIRDFSGGLNTAMDEANLPANMTASICNVDFLDSKAISRRNGYSRITATPLEADPVDAMYRFYRKDGTKWWLAIAGTALYSRLDSPGTYVPVTRLEAETAFVTGTSWITGAAYGFSANQGKVSGYPTRGTARFDVPYSTAMTVGIWFSRYDASTTAPTASLYIDSVAYNLVSATIDNWLTMSYPLSIVTRSYSGLTATTHTVQVKMPVNATNEIAIDYFDYSAGTVYTKQLTTLTATTNQYGFATLKNAAYFSSAYDQLAKFTATGVTAITATNTPSVAFLVEKGRRLFGAGSATDPTKLYYTELDDPEDWGKSGTQNGIYLAGQDSGGTCTGLAVWSDLVFFFSESATYALDTTGLPANWQAKTLSKSHGCVAPKSLAVAPNAVIFLSADGVRAYGSVQGIYSDDGSAFTILSDNITPTLMAYTDAQKKAAVGAVYNNRYWLAIGSDVYVCDLEKRTENNQPPWTKYDGHDINCMHVTRSDEYGLYAGSKTSGHLYHLDTGGNDNGAAISMLYKTPPLAPKGYTTAKHFRTLHMAAEAPQAQSMTVTVTTDDVSPAAITASFTADTDIQPKRLVTPARGRSAQVKLSSDGLEQDITVSELTMTYNPRPKVR